MVVEIPPSLGAAGISWWLVTSGGGGCDEPNSDSYSSGVNSRAMARIMSYKLRNCGEASVPGPFCPTVKGSDRHDCD